MGHLSFDRRCFRRPDLRHRQVLGLREEGQLHLGSTPHPWFLGFTGGVLALFLAVEVPNAPDLAEVAGEIAGSILAVFFGITIIGYVFFVPFFKAKLVKQDPRLRIWHIPMGPLLLKENPPLYWPGKGDEYVTNYYEDAYGNVSAGQKDEEKGVSYTTPEGQRTNSVSAEGKPNHQNGNGNGTDNSDDNINMNDEKAVEAAATNTAAMRAHKAKHVEPYPRWIEPVKHLSWANPKKWWGWFKFLLLQGVFRDCVTHDSARLREIHARAHRYDVRVEHMWTYCQVVSAMMMSIAHGSNDVANAVGPWAASYQTYNSGVVDTDSPTPVWFLAIAGLLLGMGFWFYGYHIVRALGNKITQMSPTRGFSTELGAAITVLLASRLGLPVSTTQCLTGAALGVALMVSLPRSLRETWTKANNIIRTTISRLSTGPRWPRFSSAGCSPCRPPVLSPASWPSWP